MNRLSVSIIIAIYNRKDELSELLKSLTLQTDQDFEVVIVDDGSRVDLKPVVQSFQDKLNIQYFYKDNSGPGLSRNYGAERAKNDWLVFVDSDVEVEKDYIQNIKTNLREFPTDAFGGADKAHKDYNILQKAISYSMTSIFTTGGIRGKKTSVSKFQPRSFNMGVKKSIFLEVGGFSDMRIGEDPDLSMKLWEHGYKTSFYDNIGVYHKRRTDFARFSKQVYQFGVARPILNQRHPNYTKLTFWFPSVFLLGYLVGLLGYVAFRSPWILAMYGVYTLVIFCHSFWVSKNISVPFFALISTYIQMFSYGYGFLKSWLALNVFKKNPKDAFPTHFYKR